MPSDPTAGIYPGLNRAQRRYLNSKRVRARYGDVSDMSLWRWLHDAEMNFPKPMLINGRRYWDEHELDAFDASRREVAHAATP